MAFSFFKKKSREEKKDDRYVTLTVKEVRRETAQAVSIVFEEPEEGLKYEPGQFLTLIMTVGGKKIRRAYSLCSSPFLSEAPAVTVKKVEGGAMSVFINEQVKAGDEIEVMKAMGQFVTSYESGRKRHLILFGGGSGITPLVSIAKTALVLEPQSLVSLVYCNRDEESIIFKEELEAMEGSYPGRFTVIHKLEKPSASWAGSTGLLTAAELSGIIDSLPQLSLTATEFFTCGPAPMMDIVVEGLGMLGISGDMIKRESFTAGVTTPDLLGEEGASNGELARPVKIILDGEEHTFEVPAGKTILETGLKLDLDMPYSCQSGLCTACRGKLLSGKVKMDEDDGLTQSEKEEGYVLCCVGHPETDDVTIEIG